jgi:hypothetical protein
MRFFSINIDDLCTYIPLLGAKINNGPKMRIEFSDVDEVEMNKKSIYIENVWSEDLKHYIIGTVYITKISLVAKLVCIKTDQGAIIIGNDPLFLDTVSIKPLISGIIEWSDYQHKKCALR